MREVRHKVYWQFTALSFQFLSNLYWKTEVQACKMLKSLSKRPWGSSKEILLIYYFSLPDERGENKICQFLSFSVYFWKFWLRQGGLSFYGSRKGDEGADTDLMFQFCLPYEIIPMKHHMCHKLESLTDLERWQKCDGAHSSSERSEERRVGKECRSRWSPYH